MLEEYDFSNAIKNPYAPKLKRTAMIELDDDTMDYFKRTSNESGIPYMTLINMYLKDCAAHNKTISISWD